MRTTGLLLASLLFGGCLLGTANGKNDNDGGQYGEENLAGCVVQTSTPLALDEVSALGFAPQAIVDLVSGERADTLDWTDGPPAGLQYEVVPTGAWAYEELAWESATGTEMAPALGCMNRLSGPATLHFASDDGAFAESLAVDVRAESATSAAVYSELEGLSGTFDPWAHVDPTEGYDEVIAWLDLAFDANSGVSGAINGQGSAVDGEVAWATNLQFATFGEAAE